MGRGVLDPAAEVIRYTYLSWPNANRFGTMLRNVYLPRIVNGAASMNGNWELVMMESTLGIAVFLEDRAVYDRAVARFRTRVPAFVYLPSDGALPKAPPNSGIDTRTEIINCWHGQTTFFEGLTQETCRDFTHTSYGIASIADFAETTRIQGQDLYPEIADRLRTALGFHARYELGTAPPSWLRAVPSSGHPALVGSRSARRAGDPAPGLVNLLLVPSLYLRFGRPRERAAVAAG